MDFGQMAKPAPITGSLVAARSDIVASRGSVPVDLPPEQTVQSAQAGDAVRVDVRADDRQRQAAAQSASEDRSRQTARDEVERRTLIEPVTNSIVTRETNPQTGETLQTIPDEATLKLRLMARAMAEREWASTTGPTIQRTA